MQLYHYDQWGFLTRQSGAAIDPEETASAGEVRYLVPAAATTAVPSDAPAGMVNRWNGTEWIQVDDHRCKSLWHHQSKQQSTVGSDNVIPEGWTLMPLPDAPRYCLWNADAGTWEINQALKDADAVAAAEKQLMLEAAKSAFMAYVASLNAKYINLNLDVIDSEETALTKCLTCTAPDGTSGMAASDCSTLDWYKNKITTITGQS